MRSWAVLLALALISAGCLSGADEAETEPTSTNATTGTSPRSNATSADDGDARAADPSSARTLDAPPGWRIGEWWEIELSSPLLDEGTITWTRVVAGTEGSDYLVGQPKDTWKPSGILFHVPGLGEVGQDDLGYEAHDARFVPTEFPLTDGKEWETQFEASDVTAQVMSTEGSTAELWYCCGRNVTATYDAELGAISRMEVEGLLTYEVVDHGFGFEGVVTVPHGHDLVFNHGRIAGVLDAREITRPAPPVEEVEVSDDYGRVTFAGIVGDVTSAPPVGGAYVERVTGPDGTEYTTQRLPSDGAGISVSVYETTELGGTWEIEHVAAGAGISLTEGIAYHVFDMRLPEGELTGDHSQHRTP